MDRVDLLIEVLLDPTARFDEKDDAAMDLGGYDDDRALQALLIAISDPNIDPFILDACVESIAEIWTKRSEFDLNTYQTMSPRVKKLMHGYIRAYRPEWLEKYDIKLDDEPK